MKQSLSEIIQTRQNDKTLMSCLFVPVPVTGTGSCDRWPLLNLLLMVSEKMAALRFNALCPEGQWHWSLHKLIFYAIKIKTTLKAKAAQVD